jgi:signal transduction histidine kinase
MDLHSTSSNRHLSLTRQIQISGLIALLLFIGVVYLGTSFYSQIQAQNQNYEVGTVFSDRSVTQLQREILRLRNIIASPYLADENAFLLQTALVESRLNILKDSIKKIRPTPDIVAQAEEIDKGWQMVIPFLANWQFIQDDAEWRGETLAHIDITELLINDMVRQYEVLRTNRSQSFTTAGERLGQRLAAVLLLFILFMLTVVYNTYRFIKENTRAEAQLATYAAELERSNQELQQFANVASHDLQEPLRKIRTFGERLQMRNEDKLDGRSLDYIERMNNAAERMQTLIEDLLAFARVTAQADPFVKTDLNEIAQKVIVDLEGRIEEVRGRVEVASLPTIEADPLQMRQLLQNLISNGLKFHKPDEPPLVKIYAEQVAEHGRNQVLLCVADNGIGIEAKYQTTIFGMFQRLHGRTEVEGTGVGLAICRRIVERHNGIITVRSQPNQGATFVVTLPAKQTA